MTSILMVSILPCLTAQNTIQNNPSDDIKLKIVPLLDEYGMPAINDDETFYPNDKFEVSYFIEQTNDINFEKIQVNFNSSILNLFSHSDFYSLSGVCCFEILPTAAAGTYSIYFNMYGDRTVENETQSYTIETSVLITVVEYDPHFSVELAYTVPNVGVGSSFDKPFALIIRYDGNGLDYNLNQRAVVADFFWEGYAQKLPELDTVQVTPNVTVSNFFNKNANVQFLAPEITFQHSQIILMLDDVGYSCSELPKSFFWETNTNHTYVWTQNLSLTDKPSNNNSVVEEWYEWMFCSIFPPTLNELSLLQDPDLVQEDLQNQLVDQFNTPNGTLTITQLGNTVTAIYAHNKLLDIFAKNVDVNREQTVLCLTELPLYFNAETRYAKLEYILNSKVAKTITDQNFTTAINYNLSIGCNLFGQPNYFKTNFTVDYEFYDKQFNATAYMWNKTLQTWNIDNTVNIHTVFKSAFNFTETDVLQSNLSNQTTDSTALKMALEDLYDSEPQNFAGTGSFKTNLKRTSPLYYELLVTAEQSQKIILQQTIQLNFKDNQPYNLPLNFDSSSPLKINVLNDDSQNIMLQLDAPLELGGLTNTTIYVINNIPSKNFETLSKTQLELYLLKTIKLTMPQEQTQTPLNYEQNYQQFYQYYQGGSKIFVDNLGFQGQTQIAIAKNQNLKSLTQSDEALLYVEATNVWGTTFHTILPVQPYVKPNWDIPFTQTTVYILSIVIVAIVISFMVYLVRVK
ncbi:MAG: hypothetical protein FWH37_06045 [Candidatus Bathyarchaeota archaeon]|nr:hypothetical protein [Candidatus Termiticorpusculum sp.]